MITNDNIVKFRETLRRGAKITRKRKTKETRIHTKKGVQNGSKH
jgi:hypothetical protein